MSPNRRCRQLPACGRLTHCHAVAGEEGWRQVQTPSKEPGQLELKRPELPGGFSRWGGGGAVWSAITSWTFFWSVGGEAVAAQYQPSGASWSGVHGLVGSVQLTSASWRGVHCLPHSPEPMRGNGGPLTLVNGETVLLLFGLTVFSLHVLISLINCTQSSGKA